MEAEVREELKQSLTGDEVKMFFFFGFSFGTDEFMFLFLILNFGLFVCVVWDNSWRRRWLKKWRFSRKIGKMSLMSLRLRALTYWYIFHFI